VVRVTGLVEKPSPEDAPSTYAVIGRYVLDPGVFGLLERTGPGRGGEIQLTDALQELAAAGTVRGVVFDGRRYDTGDQADYLRTVVRLACERPVLGPEFTAWLRVRGGPGSRGDRTPLRPGRLSEPHERGAAPPPGPAEAPGRCGRGRAGVPERPARRDHGVVVPHPAGGRGRLRQPRVRRTAPPHRSPGRHPP
jgi:UTP--glucose-1-phosphate uridylyltransferase